LHARSAAVLVTAIVVICH